MPDENTCFTPPISFFILHSTCNNSIRQHVPSTLATVPEMLIDISYAAPQAHGIVNVALQREYYPGIIFIFSQGGKDLYHV
jgi:hypothetical protein